MTSTPQRTPYENQQHHQHRQSLFLQDLSSPLPSSSSTSYRRSARPNGFGSATSINHFTTGTPPPPPILSLYDNPSPSHDSPLPFLISTPEPITPPVSNRSRFSASPSPVKSRLMGEYGNVLRFSPVNGDNDNGTPLRSGSPVEGLMQPSVGAGALIMLPPPREVARPELHKESPPVWELDEEVWITVFGFAPGETNLVLREFEKCGEILKWVPGPKEANWMHILYLSRYDAQKALAKHGSQLNNLLIVGVKRVDPLQHRYLNESFEATPTPLPLADFSPKPNGSSLVPFTLQSGTSNTGTRERDGSGAIASPSKSVLSRVLDLMFGI